MSIQTNTTQTTDRDLERPAAMAEGLRKLANLIEANPWLADTLSYPLSTMNAPVSTVAEPRKLMADFARATLAAGGKVDKDYGGGKWAGIDARFGPVAVHVYAEREKVCERVVVGTEEVTTEVPDPDALAAVPKVTLTETVEKVEWRCHPMLADAGRSLDDAIAATKAIVDGALAKSEPDDAQSERVA